MHTRDVSIGLRKIGWQVFYQEWTNYRIVYLVWWVGDTKQVMFYEFILPFDFGGVGGLVWPGEDICTNWDLNQAAFSSSICFFYGQNRIQNMKYMYLNIIVFIAFSQKVAKQMLVSLW